MRCRVCSLVVKNKKPEKKCKFDRNLCRECIIILELDSHHLVPQQEHNWAKK